MYKTPRCKHAGNLSGNRTHKWFTRCNNKSTGHKIKPDINNLNYIKIINYSHEIKRRLLLGRKVMTNLDSILKSRDINITLPKKVPSSQGYGFSSGQVWMWEWTVKKAECQRIDGFELWCLGRLLRVTWTARGSSQSVLKEIIPGISLEGLMLKLKLQYFGHLRRRTDSLEKTLMLGGIGGRKRKGRQSWNGRMASPTQWTSLSKL